MSLESLLFYAGAVSVCVGPLGSLIELFGTSFKVSALVAFGQRLEALGADLPKLIRGSRATAMLKDMAPDTKKTGGQ